MENKNKIAVLGGGHGAHTMAADLTLRGFEIIMYEMPKFKDDIETLLNTKTLRISGEIDGIAELFKVTTDIDEAIKGVKYIFIPTPAFAHKPYAELLKDRVTSEQVIILCPGTFGSLEFINIFNNKSAPIIAETDTLPYDTRLVDECTIECFGLNPLNIAVFPSEKANKVINEMPDLFKFEKIYTDVLECGLSSLNPALHSGPCLLNAGPIEYWTQDFYLYEHGFTPSAAKMDKKIDEERKDIGKKFGYHITGFEDFCGMKDDWDWKDLYRNIHGEIGLTPIVGPNDINNRYLTEDAPYGLVTWSSLAKAVGVSTPIIDAIVNVYSVIHERDWWKEGRTLDNLGIDGMSVEEIKKYVKTGEI